MKTNLDMLRSEFVDRLVAQLVATTTGEVSARLPVDLTPEQIDAIVQTFVDAGYHCRSPGGDRIDIALPELDAFAVDECESCGEEAHDGWTAHLACLSKAKAPPSYATQRALTSAAVCTLAVLAAVAAWALL